MNLHPPIDSFLDTIVKKIVVDERLKPGARVVYMGIIPYQEIRQHRQFRFMLTVVNFGGEDMLATVHSLN